MSARRTLVVGATIVVAVVAIRVLPWAVRRISQTWSAVRERQETLALARDVLANRSATHDSLNVVFQKIVALGPRLLDGNSAAEAQAALSSLVSLAARRHGLRIVRLDDLPDSTIGVFGRIAVEGEFEGDISGLGQMIRALETTNTLLSVRSLAISTTDPETRPGQPEVLRSQMNIVGYYLPRGDR